jgi:hypothetical protein
MPLDSCRAELSSSEELLEDGDVSRESSILRRSDAGGRDALAAALTRTRARRQLLPGGAARCGAVRRQARRRVGGCSLARSRASRGSARSVSSLSPASPLPLALTLTAPFPQPVTRRSDSSQHLATRCWPHGIAGSALGPCH